MVINQETELTRLSDKSIEKKLHPSSFKMILFFGFYSLLLATFVDYVSYNDGKEAQLKSDIKKLTESSVLVDKKIEKGYFSSEEKKILEEFSYFNKHSAELLSGKVDGKYVGKDIGGVTAQIIREKVHVPKPANYSPSRMLGASAYSGF